MFFIDRDSGKYILPNLLENAGIAVERHSDHFAQETHDDQWILSVGQRGWFILTLDKAIGRAPLERAAIATANAGVFVLTGGHLPAP